MPSFSYKKIVIAIALMLLPYRALAQTDFNPSFIISDPEITDYTSWSRNDIQQFLDSKGSYLKNYSTYDVTGRSMSATDIIYNAAQKYQINPKFILVTLQKEQSLITDDSPTQKQLDWAAGYGVCDSCSMDDPSVIKFQGFGKQVDNAAGIMRWYFTNENNNIVKKMGVPTIIDNTVVTPGSWATAFLYTYTPHLHGNANFWRIWDTWFTAFYPNGTLLVSASSSQYWLIDNGTRRAFSNKIALISRVDPASAIRVDDVTLSNYKVGRPFTFANYALLRTEASSIYMLDNDTLRPFANLQTVYAIGFQPDEITDVSSTALAGYPIGTPITVTSTAPQGIIYQITDLKNALYLFKNDTFFPITDKAIVATNYKDLDIEKHQAKDMRGYQIADLPVVFKDGTLLKQAGSTQIYVMDGGKKRPIADDDTFIAMGYKRSNVVTAASLTLMNIPTGEPLFMNTSLLSSKDKFLGDNAGSVPDLFTKNNLASYLVAEYPSGRIISGKNIDDRRTLASLTKLMTGYEAVHQGLDLTKKTTFVSKNVDTGSNPIGFKDGDVISNKDLFNAMFVASDNDAARMVAQASQVSETTLVDKINERLSEWGADDSSIHEVTGLDANDKSTARDLLNIFTHVLADKTVAPALAEPTYLLHKTNTKRQASSKLLINSNQILKNIPLAKRDYRILATKTGYTDEAQSNIIMLIESKKTKKQYIVITLGNPDYAHRFDVPHKLAEWTVTAKLPATK